MGVVTDDEPLVRRTGDALSRQIDDETVMFHPRQGTYFALGTVGSRVWQLLEEPTRLSELCLNLQQDFDVDPATCRAEVSAFLSRLREADLLVEEPS